jgi:excisionase family DNA binding protein
MGKLLSTTEAAARLGLSVARVQTFIWEERLPAQRVGRSYAIDEDDLKLLDNRSTGRPPQIPSEEKPSAAKKKSASNGASTRAAGKKKGSKK